MKNYSLSLIHKYIEENKEGLISAVIGMYEDWSPTAEEVWDKEGYHIDEEYGCIKTEEDNKLRVAGICGSGWATPQLVLHYENKPKKIFDIYEDDGGEIIKPFNDPASKMFVDMIDNMFFGKTGFHKRDDDDD